MRVRLYDESGKLFGSEIFEGDGALLLNEIAGQVPAEFRGHLEVLSLGTESSFFITVLRVEVTDSGVQLTSIPARTVNFG